MRISYHCINLVQINTLFIFIDGVTLCNLHMIVKSFDGFCHPRPHAVPLYMITHLRELDESSTSENKLMTFLDRMLLERTN